MAVSILIFYLIFNSAKSVIVSTKIGKIEGIDNNNGVSNVNAFFGIPYALPPINELRFASPQPIKEKIGNTSNPYQANGNLSTVPICYQQQQPPSFSSGPESEDCLFLNIYVPSTAKSQETNYTVMIYFHGGGFTQGAGSDSFLDATNFVSFIEDIIIVTINFRIGILGFLYDNTFDTGVIGNYGHEDQKLAIKWVYDNIEYFGGNPENINIFGESAGAQSVALQLLYNKDGYIKSGIMQSPYPFTKFRTPSDWTESVSLFNTLTNCTQYESDSNELLECWQNLGIDDIMYAQNNYLGVAGGLEPTVETEELLYQVMYGFINGDLEDIPPFIIGDNKGENNYWADNPFFSNIYTYQGLLATLSVQLGIWGFDADTAVIILDQYGITSNTNITKNYWSITQNDRWRCSIRYLLENLGDGVNSAYYYNFDIVNYNVFSKALSSLPSCYNYTCHFVDVFYVFNTDFWQTYVADNETIIISEDIQILWSNFAKTMDPNNNDNIGDIWPQYANDNGAGYNYLEFKDFNEYNEKSTFTDKYDEICEFWDNIGYPGNSITTNDPTMNPSSDPTMEPTMVIIMESMTTTEGIDDESGSVIFFCVYTPFVSFFTLFLCLFFLC